MLEVEEEAAIARQCDWASWTVDGRRSKVRLALANVVGGAGEAVAMVIELLDQIEGAARRGDYFLALFGALTLPSICGALESRDGNDTGKKYANWFDKWVGPKYQSRLNGDQCYSFRCAMLHQARSIHPKLGYDRVLFLEPTFATKAGVVLHNNVIDGALNLDVGIFCRDVVDAVRVWLPKVENTPEFKRNFEKAFKRYGAGFPPYIVGVPVITSGGSVTLPSPRARPSVPRGARPGFGLYLSLSAGLLAKASSVAPNKDSMTWVSATIRAFCDPYFRAWIDIIKTGQTKIVDSETGTEITVKKDDVEPAMMLVFGPREEPPDWLKEYRVDSDVIVPMERAFQLTVVIDKKLGRTVRWRTVNEMASNIAESRIRATPGP